MKWFKHYCTDSMDNRLVGLMEEFGMHVGYASYFLLMEHCAAKFEENEPVFHIRMKTLRQVLGLSNAKVLKFLEISSNFNLFSYKNEGNLCIITWPHLAEIADEYTKKRASNIQRKSEQALEIVSVDKKRKEKIKKEKILDAVRRFGTYGGAEAKKFFTEEEWNKIREIGGWQNICQGNASKLDFIFR